VLRVAHGAACAGIAADAIVAAMLHDTVEDCGITLQDLVAQGFSPSSVDLVRLLTKEWDTQEPAAVIDQRRAEYYARIAADPDARTLKLLDRTDNLRAHAARVGGPAGVDGSLSAEDAQRVPAAVGARGER
jgi:(p)ppGpp synthase/HD superfamily hydrolase